ncbi:C4-dicarboxylate anaerobic carrier family protein [Acinetobacter baumannii 25493_8]|uniref:short-chain fatty acid transporter n=1 Tax=Acinetobacter baumannii TaxID=470 RepID=UPI0002B94C94|nr:TIGR00366 family protein [Acinetobacter baumannii]EYD51582.1 C4-dicarboxylate anaerobic carrier family protein [Acinetobacter baumannii 25493_4]EYS14821.1 C4-dicarboxylate anaerobic carrier family protein [Acinetobacter baumannii 25569_7]EHU2135308.1 short-chain fatty acid transporter [Acinetobacter baumannii]EIG0126966.1 short-chain fatty acid transporter [Acinetobacter baumannii]EXA78331.1 C4-dicarboxylate anaerobic carrier family protein [Acinetobacter baumannii 1202252]
MEKQQGIFERFALRISDWSEKWFPDSYIFALLGVIIVSVAALGIGAPIHDVATSFGNGFWSLIPFTLQMTMLIIVGYVVSVSKPIKFLIQKMARIPSSGRGAIVLVATVSLLISLVNWAISTILTALLVIALAKRKELNMDYRAAAAAAIIGMGATWALGISSSAAQLQANKTSLPESIYNLTGVIPFTETIFLWQSIAMTIILVIVSIAIAYWSAPKGNSVKTIDSFDVQFEEEKTNEVKSTRPGDWLENSPILTIIVVVLGLIWMFFEFSKSNPIIAISSLNTYNFVFLMLGLALHGTPRNFLNAVSKAVPAVSGILIQFPLYGSIAFIMTQALNSQDLSLSHYIAEFFVSIASKETFAIVMGIYSAVLGFFVPSGGGKWIIEAPYVMQAANDLKVHLGWSVQIYNAAEALPNLINPFFMLPMLGILKLKAKDVIGFTVTQLVVHFPLVLFLLWFFGRTLSYTPPTF